MSTNSEDLFNENNDGTTPAVETPNLSVDKYADLLKAIKNEDGAQKYDSLEKALEALVHSQDYIPKLKAQLSEKEKRTLELEELLGKTSSIEDLVTRLTEKKEPDSQGNPPVASGLDEQAVAKLLEQHLAQRDIAQRAEANMSKFTQALKEKFGEKASDEVKRISTETGLSLDDLKQLATKSPEAVLKFFNVSGAKSPTPTTGGMYRNPVTEQVTDPGRPNKSLLSGAGSSKDAVEYMRQLRAHVLAEAQAGNLR